MNRKAIIVGIKKEKLTSEERRFLIKALIENNNIFIIFVKNMHSKNYIFYKQISTNCDNI